MAIQYIGIILAFAAVVVLCFKNVNVMVATIIGAFLACLFCGLSFSDMMVNTFFVKAGTYFGSQIGLYLFGAILGVLYTKSNAAACIAEGLMKVLIKDHYSDRKKRMLGYLVIMLSGGILCFGGINCIVLVFTLYPLSLYIFKQLDIPKKHLIGVILGGIFGFGISCPGTPQPTNIVPTTYLGTDQLAGLIPGLIGTVAMIIVQEILIEIRVNGSIKRGEHFQAGANDVMYEDGMASPGFLISLVPLIVVFVLFNVVKMNVNLALMIGTIVCVLLFRKYLGSVTDIIKLLEEGCMKAPVSMYQIATIVGFGAVIQATEGFQSIVNALLAIDLNPLVKVAISVALLALVAGGSSAGQTLALPSLAPVFLNMGVSAQAIHRVCVFSATTLDTNPTSGAVIMCAQATGCTLKETYGTIAMTTVLSTLVGTIVTTAVCILFPGLA